MGEKSRKPADDINRRDVLKLGAAAVGASLAAAIPTGAEEVRQGLGAAPESLFTAPPIETVRVGFVGTGLQGSGHCRNLLRIPGVELKALCDVVPEKVARVSGWAVEAGQPKPAAYTRGERDFERMCAEEDLDLVYTATPWEGHVPVLVAAMTNGKHAATEIPAAYRLEDCWRLVEHAETHRTHCVMMENCNYDRPEMMVFNMIQQGLFGEVLHAECGYLHDLRGIKFEDQNEGLWRRAHAWTRNGNLYPTHGLGPIAACSATTRTCRGPTAAFIWCRARAGSSRGIRTACTSRAAAPSIAGRRWPRTSRSSSIRSGSRSAARRARPATAAWTTWKTTG